MWLVQACPYLVRFLNNSCSVFYALTLYPNIIVIPLLLRQSQCRHETLCPYSSFLSLGYLLPVLLLVSGWQQLLV